MPEQATPDVGLGSTLLRRCALTPALPALSFEGETIDYAEFGRRVRRLAGALKRAGVNRGDRVGYDTGVRQGGPCTPRAWNRLLQFPLSRLHAQWEARGERALSWAPEFQAPCLLWADNVWLVASCAADAPWCPKSTEAAG